MDCTGDGGGGEEESFLVYPNPTLSEINFDKRINNKFSKDDKKAITLELTDSKGELVFARSVTKEMLPFKIDTTPLLQGVYYLKIHYKDKVETKRIQFKN